MALFDFTRNWYGERLPSKFDVNKIIDFCVKSNEIAKWLTGKNPKLKLSPSDSAYTDGTDIFLPKIFFLSQTYSHLLGFNEIENQIAACIAVVNGVQLHEALHIKLSPPQIDDALNACGLYGQNNALLSYCVNIVEDLYIEEYCRVNIPSIYPLLEEKNSVLASEFHFQSMINEYQLTEDESRQQVLILGMLGDYKNTDLHNHEIFLSNDKLQECVEICDKAIDSTLTLQERVALAKKLYDILKLDDNDTTCMSFGSGQDFFDVELRSNITNKLLDMFKTQNTQRVKLENEMYNIIQTFKDVTENHETSKPPITYRNIDLYGKINDSDDIEDKLFERFGEYLKFARALKADRSIPKEDGSINKNNLYRINTDGKIFQKKNNERLKRGTPQVIMLIDLSGSMRASDLVEKVIKCAYSAYKSMVDAGIDCSVYGHTTDGNDVLIVGIASNNMPLDDNIKEQTTKYLDIKNRFSRVFSVKNRENADGWVLDFVSQRFSNKTGDKMLIVVSDGMPSFSGYSGEMGIAHTKSVVENIRKSNIKVVSLSIVGMVVEDNDVIYGKENNLAAFRNDLAEQMKSVILRVV